MSRTRSTPPSRVGRPKEKRMLPCASAGGSPMARNTGDAATPPTWHAEPAETAIPSRARAAPRGCPPPPPQAATGPGPPRLGGPVERHEAGGLRKPDDSRDVLGPGPAA